MNNKEIHLRRLNFWINNRCTLRCRLCGSGIPYFRESERYDMTVNDFKRTIRSVLGYGEEAGIIDSADSIEINGGEPLLNSSLPLILEEILKYKSHFTKVRINTNGTIVPNKKLLDVLIKYNDMDTGYGLGGGGVAVYLSDYGVYSKRAGKIRGLLQSAGVECIYVKYHGKDMHYGGWVDMGDFSARGRTKDELYALFKKCPLGKSDGGCWPCWNGQIHICARSLCGTLQGLIPSKKGVDFVDIFDETANKRDIMMNILNSDYITACDYCSGDFGTTDPAKRRKPAEQITEG